MRGGAPSRSSSGILGAAAGRYLPSSTLESDRMSVGVRRVLVALAAAVTVAGSAAMPVPARAGGTGGPMRFHATVLPGGGGEPNVSISPDGRTVLVDGLGGSAQGSDQPAALWRS